MNGTAANYNVLDPSIEKRVDDLLPTMTLAEKVGQLVQIGDGPLPEREEAIRAGGVGSLLSIVDLPRINRLQRIAVEETRLGIPLIVGNDVIHGYYTTFPIPLAEACTWEPHLLEQAARVAAEEASAHGTHWIFAPMVDVCRDPRWGRIAEGAGEDPYLGSAMATARVRGFQAADLGTGRRIAACPKHYVAYGAAEAGRDYNTTDLSERALREVYLPPFRAAFEAGAPTVMTSFNDISGVPATMNSFTIRTVLREEWGWNGLVLTDYEAIAELIPHGVAADLKEAALLSMLAGVDMDMVSGAYAAHLADLVEGGYVTEEALDAAVRRVLRLKFQLGLFEHPYTDESLGERFTLREDHRELALEVARRSMVLLKNDGGLLPLSGQGTRVALIGPLADDKADLLGTWASVGQAENVETVLEALQSVLASGESLVYVKGCSLTGDSDLDIAAAVEAAREADVAVLVLGESADMSGEAHSRAFLDLPGHQQELWEAVSSTGTPAVVVVMSGRPLVLTGVAERACALLQAWHGGIRAGRAVADVLFGDVSPSGRLAVSFPRAVGQIPVYYAHKNTGRPVTGAGTRQFDEPYKSRYIDVPNEPLYPFGFGLTYTAFEYSDLRLEKERLSPDDTLVVSARVRNSGERAGEEVVQVYIRDLVGSTTRPVKELKGFRKISLDPGEDKTVRFEVPVNELAVLGPDMKPRVEPGEFRVWIGPDSSRGLEGGFRVE